MKRIQLIAAALCLILITTVGAGVVAAKQTDFPHHAGASTHCLESDISCLRLR